MDFGNAALLSLVVFVLVEVFKEVAPDRVLAFRGSTILAALALGIGSAFVVAETAWGNDNVVGGKPLDTLNGWSLLVVGILLGAGAVGIHKVLGAVKSIGENQPE